MTRSRSSSRLAIAASAVVAAALIAAGCAQQRDYVFVANPPDATIRINGVERGKGRVEATLAFSSPSQAYGVVASRPGFDDARLSVINFTPQGDVRLDLKPRVKPITVNVEPADGMVLLDGAPISSGRVTSLRYEMPFAIDAAGKEVAHVLRAERAGYAPIEMPANFTEDRSQYVLRLQPLRKDFVVTTTPPGAHVTFDGVDAGESPTTVRGQQFPYDPRKEAFLPHTIVATKAGYPPTHLDIAWDDGKADYTLPLGIFSKRVRLETDPADAALKVDGKELTREADGSRALSLSFPPINDAGALKSYPVEATLTRDGELWRPASGQLGWDDGQTNYTVKLEEILERTVAAKAVEYRVKDGRWSPTLVESSTQAFKDTTDGPLGLAKRITDLPAGSSIGSFAISPDGKRVVYSTLR